MLRTTIKMVSLSTLILSSAVSAAEMCSALLDGGIRDNYSVLTTEDTFNLYQSALCDEKFSSYDSFASSVRDQRLSLKTAKGILGLSSDQQRAKSEFNEKYSKFCSSNLSVSDVSSVFRSKKSLINSDLAKAFNECVKNVTSHMSNQGLNLYIDATPQATFSNFSVRVTRKTNSPTEITNVLPGTVKCSVGGKEISLPHKVSGSKFTLECTKPPKELVSFQIDTLGEGYSNEVYIPAEKDRLYELESRLEQLESLLAKNTPQSRVVAFAQNSCPDGWREYSQAYGRFIRGIDKNNSGIDPDGLRVAGSIQADAYKAHSHKYTDHAFGHDLNNRGLPNKSEDDDGLELTKNSTSSGGPETRPKNVALLFCQRTE